MQRGVAKPSRGAINTDSPPITANNTNRAPYPMLHLLREASIDRAVAAYPSPEGIIARNIATMEKLGHAGYQALLAED